jgi:predicted TIM-barrel fold metal-dependent hydrolase
MPLSDRIDAWTHIFPPAYFARLQTMASATGPLRRWLELKSLYDLDHRFRLMDGFAGYRQLLTPSMPPIEDLADGTLAVDLMRLMNDGLAELVVLHPHRFPAFAAALSLHDIDAALAEIGRADRMGAAGFQLCTHVRGVPLDHPRFAPVFDEIARRKLAIWLHPVRGPTPDYPAETKSRYEIWWCFGWPYDSSVAMSRLVFSGLFDRHPNLKIITHHMGAMIPYFAGRIEQGWGLEMGSRTPMLICCPVLYSGQPRNISECSSPIPRFQGPWAPPVAVSTISVPTKWCSRAISLSTQKEEVIWFARPSRRSMRSN